jgi:predicted transposase YdaD
LDIVYRTKEEVQTMLVTALAQERKKIYQQGKDDGVAEGKAAGVAEGKAAGVAEGQRQTLLQLLQHRFQLNEAEVAQIAEQLAQITEAQALTALTNQGLQAATVAEFKSALYNYLSAENRA